MTYTAAEWDNFINGHLLQSWAWGELKSRFGWFPVRLRSEEAAAQILFRRLPLGRTIAYIPKGPVLDWSRPEQARSLWTAIEAEAKKQRAIFLKIEPDIEADEKVIAFLDEMGFIAADTIQPQTSLVVDIEPEEEAILAAMKQKTRYNIRLAGRKGVAVRRGEAADVAVFHRLAQTTANRNEFGIHDLAYYRAAYRLFAPERCALIIAEYEAEPLAALIAFRQGPTAYYFFGASSNKHRNLMAPYLIQWEAIRWAREQGCRRYDLWGIPDAAPERLEAEFTDRSDGLWGVYRFKRGFGGEFTRSIGAYDRVYNPLLYRLYRLYRRG